MEGNFFNLWSLDLRRLFLKDTKKFKIRKSSLVERWADHRYRFDDLQKESFDIYISKLKFLRKNIRRAEDRYNGWDVTLTDIQCYRLGLKQNWLCAITGDPLEFVRGGTMWNGKWCNPNSCTMDRIDPSGHYCEDNVQLVTWKANFLKSFLTMSELIEFSKKVVNTHEPALASHISTGNT